MSSQIILSIIEWAGLIGLCTYVVVSAYKDIVEILYSKGIPLPSVIEKTVRERKKIELEALLEDIGLKIQTDNYKQLSHVLSINEKRPSYNYQKELEIIISRFFRTGSFKIGKTYSQNFDYYIDLMEASTDYSTADRCARILANFIRDELKKNSYNDKHPITYNRIAVPKSGSPTLGFLLSHILTIPCVFFRGDENPKLQIPDEPTVFFDGTISHGDKVILVDDSTTGGRMLSSAAEKIRQAGGVIEHAFVLFEPLGKNARERLGHIGVELHSVIQLSDSELKAIGALAKQTQYQRPHVEKN